MGTSVSSNLSLISQSIFVAMTLVTSLRFCCDLALPKGICYPQGKMKSLLATALHRKKVIKMSWNVAPYLL